MASRFTQSFAFHQSPESFISSRLQQFTLQNQQNTSPIIRAEILNRNVHLITSYQLCKAILLASEVTGDAEGDRLLELVDGDGRAGVPPGTFAIGLAYEQLMVSFFPPSNILLEDGEEHLKHKQQWKAAFADVTKGSHIWFIQQATRNSFIPRLQSDEPFDLYDALKALSWEILFSIFCGLIRSYRKDDFEELESLQESVLRGQFSLFPVPIRTPFWTSARSRGLQAVTDLGPKLNELLTQQWNRLETSSEICPFANHVLPKEFTELGYKGGELSEEEIVSHTRLFTSSIANKALASLLTAYLMNLFLWKTENEQTLARMIAGQQDKATKQAMLKSILEETLRLSPPVIGVMRRVTKAVRIKTSDEAGHIIPAGHDAWLYFSAASRDPSVFSNPDSFQWDRFMSQTDDSENAAGFGFGMGAKKCLGAELIEETCITVAETLIDTKVEMDGKVQDDGVKAWLGWDASVGVDKIAQDLKQLPCQRPRRPIIVTGRKI